MEVVGVGEGDEFPVVLGVVADGEGGVGPVEALLLVGIEAETAFDEFGADHAVGNDGNVAIAVAFLGDELLKGLVDALGEGEGTFAVGGLVVGIGEKGLAGFVEGVGEVAGVAFAVEGFVGDGAVGGGGDDGGGHDGAA